MQTFAKNDHMLSNTPHPAVKFADLIKDIQDNVAEYQVLDWDCYEASPITDENVNRTIHFINLLNSTPLPPPVDWCPQPNGLLGLEWAFPSCHIAVTISEDMDIEYGGLYHGQQIWGGMSYDGEGIPEPFVDLLTRIETFKVDKTYAFKYKGFTKKG